ncbi:MAG: hypothetical protein HQK93_06165 [Nitrospirae bacterium]|nr:hypothetical protein [Nitrospirota bacterium]
MDNKIIESIILTMNKHNDFWSLIMILAIVAGPILAVQIQKIIEKRNLEKEQKLYIFKTLMTNRATPTSPLRVEALNMIDFVFYEEEKVIDAWKLLFDHLKNDYPNSNNLTDTTKNPEYLKDFKSADEKTSELCTNLLYEMSKTLGYKFDKVSLKRSVYKPQGWELSENMTFNNLVNLSSILAGQKALSVEIKNEK